ncbi:MAG: penicillin-binding protein 2 [Alphaproteobacteria bacterium]
MNRDWNRSFPSRRNIFMIGSGVVWLGLTARLAQLQIFQAKEYETKATENRIRLDPAPPHRGTVYDRAGKILAGSKRNFYVTLRREAIEQGSSVAELVERIGLIIPLSDSRKRQILQDAGSQARFVDTLVADDLTWEEFARINVMAPELSGVSAEVGELRSYPYLSAFYHTVGYVAKANDADVARMLESELSALHIPPDSDAGKSRGATLRRLYKNPQMRVGKMGVEASAETALKGTPGKTRVLVNAAGRIMDRLPSEDIAGQPGTEIVLSLDAELQNYAIQRFGDNAGSAVVIDVETGHVLCMMSTPAPDPNAFISGISNALYNEYRNNEKAPLYHKAYEGVYPPGSTFKPIVAAAALESGAMTPEDTVHCSGKAWFYDRFYHCWRPQGHGSINMHGAIQRSCDCYFYEAAKRTGIEAIAAMAKRFGLGHRYELGITGGKVGAVPNDEWKRTVAKQGRWQPGDTISAGIGQGYVTSTPLQLAVEAARLAGGPSVPNPKLVIAGIDVPDSEITPMGEISQKTLDIVRAGMFAVCSEPGGTAYQYLPNRGSFDPNGELPAPYTNAKMAGKSGSAQVRAIGLEARGANGKQIIKEEDMPWKLRDHAWFIAYAPADKPRYAVSILIEHGSHGSGAAAPFAYDILLKCLKDDPGAKPVYSPKKGVASAAPLPTSPSDAKPKEPPA